MVSKDTTTGQPRGRESLLTARRVETIIAAIEKGHFIENAATLAGVSKSTYNTWKRRGENEIRRVDAIEGYDATEIVDIFIEENGSDLNKAFSSFADPIFDQREWPYVLFATLLAGARARFIDTALDDIRVIAANNQKPDWRAWKWLLEMTQPEQYGQHKTITHEGNPDAPLVMEIPTPEDLTQRLIALKGGAK